MTTPPSSLAPSINVHFPTPTPSPNPPIATPTFSDLTYGGHHHHLGSNEVGQSRDEAMDEYTHHTPGGDHSDGDVGLDTDMLHDFGEGVGVDMRDFAQRLEDHKDGIMNVLGMPSGGLAPPGAMASTNGSNPTVNVDDMFHTESGLDGEDDDDEDENGEPRKRVRNPDVPGGFTYVDKDGESGRRKIRIEYIGDKSRRHITFSKRKAGIMKKAYELSILTGTQVLLLVVSETGLVYTFTTTKLQPLVQKSEGKNLIQACLNAPDGYGPDGQPLVGPVPATKAKNGGLAIRPHKLTAAASAAMAASAAQAASQQAASQNNDSSGIQPPIPDTLVGAQVNAQQASAADAVGQGTPVSARPKKRMPSGRKKNSQTDVPSQPEHIPPVPQIPDMHRQPSPHGMMHLQSPLSGGYHMPPEYAHHNPNVQHHPHHQAQQQQHHQQQQQQQHQPSPTNPTFGYTDGTYGYYNPQAMGNQYLNLSPGGMHGGPSGPGSSPGAGPPGGMQAQQAQGPGPNQAQMQQSMVYQDQERQRQQRMMMAGQI